VDKFEHRYQEFLKDERKRAEIAFSRKSSTSTNLTNLAEPQAQPNL
jgi:hypothetical protein